MKMRILDCSLRLRLERSELRDLLRLGRIERHANFGDTALTYAVNSVTQAVPLRATLIANRIDVFVGAARLREWAQSEESSLEGRQSTGGSELCILLEKDFPCQHSGSRESREKCTPQSMRLEISSDD